MKKFRLLFSALAFITLVFTGGSTFAQTINAAQDNNNAGNRKDYRDHDVTNDNDSGKLGLIGLLGLFVFLV